MDEPALDLVDLNQQYQEYLHYYNTVRPHLGINLNTPLQQLQGVQ